MRGNNLERPTSAGTGAGDVYVVGSGPGQTGGANIVLAACTNSLNCGTGAGEVISGTDSNPDFHYVRVSTDGIITISYVNVNSDGTLDIKFLNCKPVGAPNPPTCAAPALVQHVSQPIFDDLTNVGLISFTYPKLANRAESGGKFTTFLVYDDCKSPFVQGNPPFTVCLGAEVVMTISTDNGKSWSAPVSVDSAAGHHFYPSITTDASTAVINIAYYSTEGDKFVHAVRVFRNQINPGGITIGAPQAVPRSLIRLMATLTGSAHYSSTSSWERWREGTDYRTVSALPFIRFHDGARDLRGAACAGT